MHRLLFTAIFSAALTLPIAYAATTLASPASPATQIPVPPHESITIPTSASASPTLLVPQTLAAVAVNPVLATTSLPAGDKLHLSDPGQPAPSLAPAGAEGVPFTTILLTAGDAPVEVRGITIERGGPAEDRIFEAVGLSGDGEDIADERRFDANHRAFFETSLTIAAHESQTITVLASITDDTAAFAGQMPSLRIVAIDTSAPLVGISLPFAGTAHTINDTISLGGAIAFRSPEDPATDTNRFIHDVGVRFSGLRITPTAQEDLTLSSITWTQSGTAGSGDIANVETIVDGVPYPTEEDARSYTTTFAPGIRIPKGHTIDLHVRGDLTITGAQRTVQFDVDSSDDIALSGTTYGFDVGITAGGNTATDGHSVFITSDGTEEGDEGAPFYAGSVVTINAGTAVSIGR